MTLRAEVQALDCAPVQADGGSELLGAVDAYGTLVMARCSRQHHATGGARDDNTRENAANADNGFDVVTTAGPQHATSEPSWAGLAFAPGAPHVAATARHLARAVRVGLLNTHGFARPAEWEVHTVHTLRWMCTMATCMRCASTRPGTPRRSPSCA